MPGSKNTPKKQAQTQNGTASSSNDNPAPLSSSLPHPPRSFSLNRRRSSSLSTNRSEACETDIDEDEDDYLAEPASEEIFSGPVSESVPSAYSSFHHRRYSSRHRSHRDSSVDRYNESDLASSVGSRSSFVLANRQNSGLSHHESASAALLEAVAHAGQTPSTYDLDRSHTRRDSIASIDSEVSLSRLRSESFSQNTTFRFFSQDEIEQAEGASTVPNEVDPVEYEVLRRTTENEEYIPEESVSDYINSTPHQHPSRYAYEDSSVLLRHQAEIELAREVNDNESAFNQPLEDTETGTAGENNVTDGTSYSGSRHIRRRSSDHYLHRWNTQDSEEPLLSRINSRISQEPSPKKYSSANTQQRFYLSEEDMVIFIAGYNSGKLRVFLYYLLCISTFGMAYLVLRWLPRWHIACLGTPAPLGQCDWVVVENQWGEVSVIDVSAKYFNRPLSQVFRLQSMDKEVEQEEQDYQRDSEDSRNNSNSGTPNTTSGISTPTPGNGNGIKPYHIEDEDLDDPNLHTLRIIEYRYIKFYYNPIDDIFLTNYDWVDPNWLSVEGVREGIDSDSQAERKAVFGPNLIDIEEKTTVELLVDEVLHPFYVFQVFSMLLWAFDEYYYYATCILIISVISVGNTLIETKQTMKRLRELARFVSDIRVLRSGYWITIPSSELMPGDIYEVSDPSISIFPCDSLLLSGDCVINESMLTGESVPVSKYPVTDEALRDFVTGPSQGSSVSADLTKHFLYSGTKVVQVRRPVPKSVNNYSGHQIDTSPDQLDVAVAMVVRTGFMTTKGSLVRSMLFPKPSGFKFYQDSFKYIGVMAVIAILGFSYSIVDFIKMHMSTRLIIFRALDLITIVVPPALPATLTIGTNISLSRLRQKKIFCISPSRVNVGGKLDIVCFDKTGTLTEDGLDVLGIHVQEEGRFSDLLQTIDEVFPFPDLSFSPSSPVALASSPTISFSSNSRIVGNGALKGKSESTRQSHLNQRSSIVGALTTCHLLRKIDGELLGDPLDHKMFTFTNWQFEEEGGAKLFASDYTHEHPVPIVLPPPSKNRPEGTGSRFTSPVNTLGTIHSFDFVPRLRRMSVLVKSLGETGSNNTTDIFVYVKGAPEIMPEVCDPSTFPEDYEDLLYQYTHRGYRVIACATKTYHGLSTTDARKLKRNEVESNLSFLGFIVFENRLKPTTTRAIEQLNDAHIRTAMCTGDNVLTAISVAKECRMVDEHIKIFVPRFDSVPDGVPPEEFNPITWEYIDDRQIQLDSNTLLPTGYDQNEYIRTHGEPMQYALAVTGDAFRYIVQFGSSRQLEHILMKGSIFARMSPDEKHELVEKLQSLDYTTGFCGDGANDVGALKAADVGISLSEAEASVAAPFTSQVFEISCVLDVIAEGRSALVTSFSCFKYMSLYSAIQFITVSILYSLGSNLGDFQFLWIDLFLILPIAIVMAWSEPFPVLSIKRPTANLVSSKVLVPLLGQIVILAIFQYFIWELCRKEPYYVPPVMGGDDSDVDSTDNSALFLFSSFQYIFVSILLTVGPPYHEPIIKNKPFVFTIIATVLLTMSFMSFPPDSWVGRLMNMTFLEPSFKLFILGTIFVNFFVSKFFDDYVFLNLAVSLRRFCLAVGLPAKKVSSKLYKRILKSMEFPKEV